MSKHHTLAKRNFSENCTAEGLVFGQVLVIAFEVSMEDVDIVRLDDQRVPITIKPHYNSPFWKFPGGMVRWGEEFDQAALEELEEETGVITDNSQLVLIHEIRKKQLADLTKTFPIKLYIAFGCNFNSNHERLKQKGDEGEVIRLVRFGDIHNAHSWEVPSWAAFGKGPQIESFFPSQLKMLEDGVKNFSIS